MFFLSFSCVFPVFVDVFVFSISLYPFVCVFVFLFLCMNSIHCVYRSCNNTSLAFTLTITVARMFIFSLSSSRYFADLADGDVEMGVEMFFETGLVCSLYLASSL
jgi:hypothetical protein